jgi:hypothetical protein
MNEDNLTDRECVVLALFRYGLATTPDEVAQQLHAPPHEIVRICHALALAGFLQAVVSAVV